MKSLVLEAEDRHYGPVVLLQVQDERFGRENRGDELPEELDRRRDRLEKIQEAKADLEKEAKRGRAEEVQAKADRAKGRAETHESKKERKRSETLGEKWDNEAEQLREEADEQVGAEVPEAETPEGMPKHRPKCETDGTPKPKAQRNFTDPDSRIMDGSWRKGESSCRATIANFSLTRPTRSLSLRELQTTPQITETSAR